MNKLLIASLAFTGLFMILSGVGYIEQAPLTLHDTLIGACISLIGIVLCIVAMLTHYYIEHRNDI